jgi:hypothetical protein
MVTQIYHHVTTYILLPTLLKSLKTLYWSKNVLKVYIFSFTVNDGSYSTFSAHSSSSIIQIILSAALIATASSPTPHTLKRCMYT